MLKSARYMAVLKSMLLCVSKSRDFQPLDLFSLPILHVSVKLCSNAKAFSSFFSNFVSKFLASWLHIVLLYSMIFLMHCYCKKWLFFFQLQCKIEFDKERRQFFIYDVGSRNGTFLNGLRLSEVSSITVIHVKCMKYYIWTSGKIFIEQGVHNNCKTKDWKKIQ